jgi:hypothetical protein
MTLRERLAEIDAVLAKATSWGARLTPLIEERRAILRNIGGQARQVTDGTENSFKNKIDDKRG